MGGAALILVSCGSETEARTIARALVDERHAAGVQVFPISSIYRWKGEVIEDGEWLLVVKTHADRYADVEAFVLEHHSYKVPQVIMLPISEGHGPYLNWIDEHTR